MTRTKLMLGTCALVVLALLSPPAGAQAPGPVVAARHEQEFAQSPGAFDLVQVVVEFAPGSETAPHVHGGNGQVTILEGEVVLRAGGTETRFAAGEGFAEKAGERLQVANVSGSRARLVMAAVLPNGQALTTPAGSTSKPAPTVLSQHQMAVVQPGPFDLVQIVQEFAPGARTPPHSHGGNGQVNVIEGDFELRTAGRTQRFAAGAGFTEAAGQTMQVVNVGAGTARIVVAFVLPKGAQLTTNRSAVGLASTGLPALPAAAVGFWLIAVGGLLMRLVAPQRLGH